MSAIGFRSWDYYPGRAGVDYETWCRLSIPERQDVQEQFNVQRMRERTRYNAQTGSAYHPPHRALGLQEPPPQEPQILPDPISGRREQEEEQYRRREQERQEEEYRQREIARLRGRFNAFLDTADGREYARTNGLAHPHQAFQGPPRSPSRHYSPRQSPQIYLGFGTQTQPPRSLREERRAEQRGDEKPTRAESPPL
jgi:hypothetical protein